MTALHFTLLLQMLFAGMFYDSVNYPHREVILLFLEKQNYKCKYSEAANFFSKLKEFLLCESMHIFKKCIISVITSILKYFSGASLCVEELRLTVCYKNRQEVQKMQIVSPAPTYRQHSISLDFSFLFSEMGDYNTSYLLMLLRG